jgi:hypothetical protein
VQMTGGRPNRTQLAVRTCRWQALRSKSGAIDEEGRDKMESRIYLQAVMPSINISIILATHERLHFHALETCFQACV